jgi:tRNA-dihydrouridine synthase 3
VSATSPFQDAVVLAPLTVGGNLPFRRLCVDFGATITCSEMAYARELVRGGRKERALLRHHPSEPCYGVQLATRDPAEAVEAGRIAVDAGARFVDLNCGCPIHEVTRRGLGAALLERPAKLGRIVEAMASALPVPVTVKIRAGWDASSINARTVARVVEEAGAAALTVHGRTREQRYARAADYGLVAEIAAERSIPVFANGDLLTWYEVEDKVSGTPIAGVMLARGALIKPWLFAEILERRERAPDAAERLAILHRFAGHLREHFGDDDLGRRRAMTFLPWHLSLFHRYRPLPEDPWREAARSHPLLQTRMPHPPPEPLERALASRDDAVHAKLADLLWDERDPEALEGGVRTLGASLPALDAEEAVDGLMPAG